MLHRRSVIYILSALILAAALVEIGRRSDNAQAQTKVSPAVQPMAPVRVVIAEAGAVGENLPARLAGKAYVQNYIAQNLSSANVLALTVLWTPKDAEGESLPGMGCSSHFGVTTALPVLKAGESKTFQNTLAEGAPHAEAKIDLVLLDNGAAFGANQCRVLETIQARLFGIKMTHLAMLRVLETRGPRALEDFVRARAEEYKQEGHDDAFMKPKFIGR